MAFPTGWTKKCSLTIDNTKVSGSANLTNFPVLLTEANFPSTIFDNTQSAGQDLRFTSDSAGTTELAFEIVNWDTTNDKAEVWVKIPTVDYDDDTIFYVWYGNSSASAYAHTDTYGTHNVWDSNYGLVSHDGGITDSTSNHNNGTATGTTEVDAKIGKGRSLNGTSSDYITIPDSNSLDVNNFTISFWLKRKADSENYMRVLCKDNNYNDWLYYLQIMPGDNDVFQGGFNDATSTTQKNYLVNGTVALGTADYNYATLTFNGTTEYLYTNGGNAGSANYSKSVPASTGNLYIGRLLADGTYYYDANVIIDEIRISNIARSSDWIATEYNNQSSPSTFVIEGTEESAGITGIAASKRIINC